MTQPSFLRRLLQASLTACARHRRRATPIATAALTPAQAQVSAEFQSALAALWALGSAMRAGAKSGCPTIRRPTGVPTATATGSIPRNGAGTGYRTRTKKTGAGSPTTTAAGRMTAGSAGSGFRTTNGAPAWVDWRCGDDYVGWAPLPPDDVIYEYDDAPAYWVFVPSATCWPAVAPSLSAADPHDDHHPQHGGDQPHGGGGARRNGRSRSRSMPASRRRSWGAARRSPVPAFRVSPHVLPSTRGVVGAVAVRPQELARPRPGQRNRALAPRIQQHHVAVQPATSVAKPQPLGKNQRGRLGRIRRAPRRAP